MLRLSSVLCGFDEYKPGRYLWHWCPACKRLHPLPPTWQFDGSLEKPTFTPSFFQNQSTPSQACHYIVTSGVINWCGGSWHGHVGSEPMTVLTDEMI